MLRYREAKALIVGAGNERRLEPVSVTLEDCVGRWLAEDIVSSEPVPRFASSNMDGFALRAEETAACNERHPLRLSVVGRIFAGEAPALSLGPGSCAEIMTGAVMPDGADAVIRLEDVACERDSAGDARAIIMKRAIAVGAETRLVGADLKAGERVLKAGVRLLPEHLLLLATLGYRQLLVRRKPRVLLISTGQELVDYRREEALAKGQIRNATTPYLLSALSAWGAEASYLGNIPDDRQAFVTLLHKASTRQPDLILTTGAVSAGRADFIVSAIAEVHARVIFHKVACRPGKPLLFARLEDGTPLFGLPGNPLSSLVGLRFFVVPYLLALAGGREETVWSGRLNEPLSKPEGFHCFMKAEVHFADGGAMVGVAKGQASFKIGTAGNAWAIVPDNIARLPSGGTVDFVWG